MWRVRLEGDAHDLAGLARALPAPGPCVISSTDGVYYLGGPAIQADDAAEVLARSKPVIAAANAGARVSDPGFRPVRLGVVVDGEGRNFAFIEGAVLLAGARASASIQIEVRDASGRLVAPPPQPRSDAELMVELSALVPAVSEVVQLIGGRCEFVELYKILEIVEHDRGLRIHELRWVSSKGERQRFTGSANHPGSSGALARHARPNSETPPSNPMTLADATTMMFGIVDVWLRTLAAEHGLALTRPAADGDHAA